MRDTTTRSAAIGALAALVAVAAVVGLVLLVAGATRTALSPTAAAPSTPAPPSAPPAQAVAVTTPAVASPALVSIPAPVQAPVPAPAVPADVPGIPCSIPAVGDGACVSLGQKKAWLIRNGKADAPVRITSGRQGHRTPTGSFAVEWKDADHLSKEFDEAPMPWSVFFTDGIAFHAGSLSQLSHGCIHLANSTAKLFFSTLQEGEPVEVVN